MDDPLDAVAGNVLSLVVHCEVPQGGRSMDAVAGKILSLVVHYGVPQGG